jgi:inorganic pyrophosphatase
VQVVGYYASRRKPVSFSTYTQDNSGSNTLFTTRPAGSFHGTVHVQGTAGAIGHKLCFQNAFGRAMSPWHDIRLQTAEYGTLNVVIETPKDTAAILEVATAEEQNPIIQAVKDGEIHKYPNPSPFNLGMFPQTWSDPKIKDAGTELGGDFDPLDVVEIGAAALPSGSVVPSKPLGILAMVVDDKLDWKVIAISMTDPLAAEVHDLEQLEAKRPEVIGQVREWLRNNEAADGVSFAYDEKALPRAKANEVIAICFDAWRELRFGNVKDNAGLWTQNVTSWTDGL